MTSRRHLVGIALLGAAVVGASCSNDSALSSTPSASTSATETTGSPATSSVAKASIPVPADGFSVVSSLRQIPSVVQNADDSNISIVASDLDAAGVLAGVARPPGTADVDAVTNWARALNGQARDAEKKQVVFALLPVVAHLETSLRVDEFARDVGWSIVDVHTFVEHRVRADVFTVMTGGFSADALTDVIGEPVGGIWSVGGADFSTDVANATAARPLGESLRFALRDDTLAVSRSTPPVEAWQELANHEADGTLATDDGLLAVATALDEAEVYTAIVGKADFGARSTDAPTPTTSVPAGLGPLVDAGVGLTVQDGQPLAVLVHYFADETSAAAGADKLADLLENGVSDLTTRPWKRSFAIRHIAAEGQVVTTTLEFKDFHPANLWNILFALDNLFAGSR